MRGSFWWGGVVGEVWEGEGGGERKWGKGMGDEALGRGRGELRWRGRRGSKRKSHFHPSFFFGKWKRIGKLVRVLLFRDVLRRSPAK